MQVSVEKTSSLGRRLTVEVPAARLQVEEKSRLQDLAKELRLEGFRRGKVPAEYIQKKYGAQIRQEAISKVLQQTLGTVLKEQNLNPANRPNVEDLKDVAGENLTYTVSFEVYPEIQLQDFSKIELTKEVPDIQAKDIEAGIQKLQDQFATWTEVTDRPAKMDDKLVIDFVGMLNGEAFEHGSANDQTLILGSRQFIPGFEEGLVGAEANRDTTIDVTFPSEYHAANLAGKQAQFAIKVKSIQSKVLAPVDAAFAERIGITDKDVNKITETVRTNMLKYVEDLNKNRLREQALEKLYAQNTIDVPQALLDEEVHRLIHEKQGDHNHNNSDVEHNHDDISSEQMAELRTEAQKRIAIGLLLNEIIKKNNLQPEEERVLAKLGSMALMYGGKADMLRKMYYESKEMRENIQNMVLTEQAADLVVANATIKEQQANFYDIVNKQG